jgi:hypothetical protein
MKRAKDRERKFQVLLVTMSTYEVGEVLIAYLNFKQLFKKEHGKHNARRQKNMKKKYFNHLGKVRAFILSCVIVYWLIGRETPVCRRTQQSTGLFVASFGFIILR